MKFAVHYEIQLPTPWEDGDENRAFNEALDHVELADRLGFDHVWAVEHHFTDDHSLSSSPATWLATAAGRTKRIRIGHGIACTPPNFVHPARLAEHIATLDQVSNGRVEFGTGESASRMELEGFGVEHGTKREAWLEATREICNMMAMKPYPGFEGDFFSMPCRNLVPKPYQKPHPPLWVAGKPELAAQHGMGCLGFNAMSGEMAKHAVNQYYRTLMESCVPIGHAVNPNIAILAPMHVHRDRDVAMDRAEHLKFFGYSVSELYLQGEVKPGRQRGWEAFEKIRDQMPAMGGDNPTSAIGTPEQVREHMRVLEDAGVDQVLLLHQGGKLRHDWNCESLELFAREIMPEFLERHDAREASKREKLAPHIEAAMARKEWRRELTDDEIPTVRPYGSASFIPTEAEAAEASARISEDTKGALGLA